MATEQAKRRALLQREAERRRGKDNLRQQSKHIDPVPQRKTQVMAVVRQWLGLPGISTKDKIAALRERDDELSSKLHKQFSELEGLLLHKNKAAND